MSLTYIGRRKCAIATVRFVKGNGDFIINGKTGFNYLQEDPFAIQTVVAPLKLINLEKKYNIICSVHGGGICAQAEAIQLGIARALCSITLPISSKTVSSDSTEDKNVKNSVTNSETNAVIGSERTNRSAARPLLKEKGYLRRDSRIKERRKYGLKKARKAEQYSKR